MAPLCMTHKHFNVKSVSPSACKDLYLLLENIVLGSGNNRLAF